MKSREWQAVNSLLRLLEQNAVASLVEEHYMKYGNPAPGQLLRHQIATVQLLLDVAGEKEMK